MELLKDHCNTATLLIIFQEWSMSPLQDLVDFRYVCNILIYVVLNVCCGIFKIFYDDILIIY